MRVDHQRKAKGKGVSSLRRRFDVDEVLSLYAYVRFGEDVAQKWRRIPT